MTQGILYVSADDDYLDEATRSARSVRRHLPDVDIGIITDADTTPSSRSRREK